MLGFHAPFGAGGLLDAGDHTGLHASQSPGGEDLPIRQTVLCLRLLGEQASEQDAAQMVEELLEDPTSLHRRLTSLVIEKSGKDPDADFRPQRSAMFSGQALRHMLQCTAEAMTVLLCENIGRDDLKAQLRIGDEDLDAQLHALEGEERLSRLLISFFFRSGHRALGCEFSHKSFREYLYSERVVEILKGYGRVAGGMAVRSVPRRYHADFSEPDPRLGLTRSLLYAFGASGLSPEEDRHIDHLLRWEIERARTEVPTHAGADTQPCNLDQWVAIRDGLADAWEHWTDGAQLRSQVAAEDGCPRLPAVLVVADAVRPPEEIRSAPRLSTLDAQYGWALFRLACLVHGYLAASAMDQAANALSAFQCLRNGQVALRPSGYKPGWLRISCSRVAAVGYRVPHCPSLLRGAFLPNADLTGVDLRQVDLSMAELTGADLQAAVLQAADLSRANLTEALMAGADLQRAHLREAKLDGASLREADLRLSFADRASFRACDLTGAKLDGATLWSAVLQDAQLDGAQLQDARLDRANLSGALFNHANLRDAVLRAAQLRGAVGAVADMRDANLSHVYGWGVSLRGANLEGADLSYADLRFADLRGAKLNGAILRGATLRHAKLSSASFGDAIAFQAEFSSDALTVKQQNALSDQGAAIRWFDD